MIEMFLADRTPDLFEEEGIDLTIYLGNLMVGLDIRSGELVPVLREYEPEELPIYAVYIHRKHLSTKVRTFVDFMVEHFQPTPYWDSWIKENPISATVTGVGK